jgi:zinc protease
MKTKMSLFLLVLTATAATFTTLSQAAAQAASWQQIPIPSLPAFTPQQPKRIELANGMVIFLQEDHELPLVDGTARIRGGSVNEPASKVGLVDIYGEVWRTGGTKTRTGDQLDDFLEVRAAKVETGGGPDSTTISFSCLKGDLDDVFKAFADVLQNPEFRAEKIDIAQKELFDGISRRNDDVAEIAQRESVKLAYGANNPYARNAEYATVCTPTTSFSASVETLIPQPWRPGCAPLSTRGPKVRLHPGKTKSNTLPPLPATTSSQKTM